MKSLPIAVSILLLPASSMQAVSRMLCMHLFLKDGRIQSFYRTSNSFTNILLVFEMH